ncbi:hypothetical protein RFI_07415 [Reticulomyxa filosa]|uniref:AAA+ ATPase domain-containing protein n=1 Tax=Reticulomyxa filosa TaxID=46433 RepID=X6NTT2_RETFI|nr:hypothetical protein RFI_07415 [Reticulomyxa filosa]|eukprot:ETO29705.1 hypothetical protein RFI_07415 [Reticulomyxa filosa]
MSFLWGSGGGSNNSEDEDREDGDEIGEDVKGKVVADFDPTALERGAQKNLEISGSCVYKGGGGGGSIARDRQINECERRIETSDDPREDEANGGAEARARIDPAEPIAPRAHSANGARQQDARERVESGAMEGAHGRRSASKAAVGAAAVSEKKKAQEEFLQKQRQVNEENIRRQQQSNEEMEKMKLKTLEHKHRLDQELAKTKAKAKMEAQIELERKNEEIHLRSQRERLQEERKTQLEVAKEKFAAWRDMAKGSMDTLTDQHKMKVLGFGIVGIALGVYTARKGVNIAGQYIESRLGKPNLVRETSRWSPADYLRLGKWRWYWTRWWHQQPLQKSKELEELKGIILAPHVKNKMQFIARATRNTKQRKGPFRHLCIYGPPGTGKTLFARTLSRDSGLDYAIISGGDFAQLGPNAVTELHKVFDWAEAARKGTILFIDEADAFLRKGREGDVMSEHMRNALSAFLYRTGTETTHFMIVLATNVPGALDKAVLDRIDDLVEFPLPGDDERKEMLQHYFNQFISQANSSKTGFFGGAPIVVKGFEEDPIIWDRLTDMTKGLSGRQIAKYMIHVQATMYGSSSNTELTPFLMQQLLETFLKSRAFGLE